MTKTNTFRFTARVDEKGNIHIPKGSGLEGSIVEVFLLQNKPGLSKREVGEDFIQKWSGFFSDHGFLDEKDERLRRIMDKHLK